MAKKPKLAFYWASSCGGCEITVTELGMRLVDLSELVDIVFWPAAMDFKYEDLESIKNKDIDICFFNGAIRNDENEKIAKLLRKKSKLLVAFGSCSYLGGIPGLANLFDVESLLERVFDTAPSLDNSRGTRPQKITKMPEGDIELPMMYDRVKTLAQTVGVDYYMPGCPPVVDQVWKVFQLILADRLPPKGSVIGVDEKTVCDVCPREKGESGMRIKEFKRPHEVRIDPSKCFLTQGIICLGPVTRAGCGLPCIKGNMPCRGCYGPPEGVVDQGAKLASVIGALIDTDEPEKLQEIMDTIVDPVGLSYRFELANSIISELKYRKK
ncbi:MAG TPA: oxidoreductase [Anaerolineae bacterium]|nr:oxidoreductase [Anaerolineae bacterium]